MKNIIDTLTPMGFKRHILGACLTGGLLLTGAAQASAGLALDEVGEVGEVSHTAVTLGTPASFLQQLDVEGKHLEGKSGVFGQQKHFALTNHLGESFAVVAKDFSLDKDGTLSMAGEVVGVRHSKFILQGNDDKVYGWVIFEGESLDGQNKAFEYTTKNGQLMVDEINITDVRPICEFERRDGFDFEHLQGHDHTYGKTVERSAVNAGKVEPHIGAYSGEDVSSLESKPGSSYVLLLDTSQIMNGNTPTDRTPENLWITWQIVAASFSMFDINVTTDRSVYDQAAPSRRGGGTLYTQSGRSSCHFAFGTSTFCTLYKESDAYGQGRIAAHEYGHLFHLSHDGGAPGGEYHNGLADFEWVPVMGNIWYGTNWNNALYQWSRGEYSGASNGENDFNILTSFVPYKADDVAGSRGLTIGTNGSVNAGQNYGQIERNTDTDSFTFNIGPSGGSANLTIDRIEHIGGGMLDVQAYLRNSSGSIVAQSNKSKNRSATINTSLSQGSYTLEIAGGAEGSASHGFTQYSSLGYYGIEGTVSGADSSGGIPTTPTGLSSSNVTSSSFTASWNSVNGATNYDLQLWSDAAGAWQNAGSSNTNSKNLAGLTVQDQWVRVRASNSAGTSSYSDYIYVQLQSAGCTSAPLVPSGLYGNSSQINWSAVSGATGYDVQYWLGYWANHGSTASTSYNLGLSGTQYVRVSANNSCGSSNYSNWIQVN